MQQESIVVSMKKFFKTLWNVIWPFLVYYAAALLVTFALYMIFAGKQLISGEGLDMTAVYDTVMNASMLQVLLVSVIVIPIYWIGIYRERTVDKQFEKFVPQSFKTYIIMAICAGFAAIAANFFNYVATMFFEDPLYDMVANILLDAPLWVEILVAVIIGPLAEEVMFRGKLYETIDKAYGPVAAIVVTSLLFGIFHGNLTQLIYAAMLGCLLGYVRYKTGSLTVTIIMHMAANLSSVLVDLIIPMIPAPNIMYADLIIECLLTMVSLGVVVVSIIYINQKTRRELSA